MLTLDGDFFAGLPAGINTLDFLVTDTDGSEGKAAARIAVAGATGLVSSDLWFGTATQGAAVTDPGVVSVKIRYRVQAATSGRKPMLCGVPTDIPIRLQFRVSEPAGAMSSGS